MAIENLFKQSIIWRSFYFVTALFTNILLSRYLQAALSGAVLYLANIFAFIALALGLGLDTGLTYFASRKLISYKKLVSFSVGWVAAVVLLGVVTSGFFLPSLLNKTTSSIHGVTGYSLFYIAGVIMMNFFQGLFYAKSNFWLPNLIYTFINILVIIAIPVVGYYYKQQPSLLTDAYFYSTFLQGLLLVPVFIISYTKKETGGYLPSFVNVKQLVRFSVMALGANIIFFLINRVDFYFVEKYCTAGELGNYINVARLGQMLLFFPQVLASVIFPQTAENKPGGNVTESTLIIGRLLSRIYVIVFILAAATGKWVFPLVFGHTFTNMYGLTLIFLPGFFALSHLAVIAAFFLGNAHIKINMTGTIIALVFVIAGDILVVQRFGVYAAAVVSSLAFISNFIYAVIRFRRKYNVSFTELFVWQKKDMYWVRKLMVKNTVADQSQ